MPLLLHWLARPNAPPRVEPRISNVVAPTDWDTSTVTCVPEKNAVIFAIVPPAVNERNRPTCPGEKIAALAVTVMPDCVAVIGALVVVVLRSCETPSKYRHGRWLTALAPTTVPSSPRAHGTKFN